MLQHAARYLADQDWVKTDSMKTIENTAVPIIQLVAQMPLQPLQASSPPSEKAPEENVPIGLHSPRDCLSDENAPPGQTLVHGMSAPEGVAGEERGLGNSSGDLLSHPVRSLSAPGAESSVGNGLLGQRPSQEGVQTPLETVPPAGGAAQHPGAEKQIRGCQLSGASDILSSVDKGSSSLSGRSSGKEASEGGWSAEGAKMSAEAALRRPLANDRGTPASDGGLDSGIIDSEGVTASSEESETGFRENGGAHVPQIQGEMMRAHAEADLGGPGVGALRGDTVGICSLGADTAAGSVGAFSAEPGVSTSAMDTSAIVGLELPGAGSQSGREGARADVSADVGADAGTLERRASDAGDLEGDQMSTLRGLELRERERAQNSCLKEGGKLQPNVMKSAGARHVPLIRTRADVDQLERGHVEGAHSPGDQERRLVKLDISFEGVQHTGSRTTDLVGFYTSETTEMKSYTTPRCCLSLVFSAFAFPVETRCLPMLPDTNKGSYASIAGARPE
jgi:hypothetical protein